MPKLSNQPKELEPLRTFEELEAIVERGRLTFVEAGEALAEIRDRRLYLEGYRSFDAYCKERWGYTSRYANYQIKASEEVRIIVQERAPMRTIVPIGEGTSTITTPTTEGEVRGILAQQRQNSAQISKGSQTQSVRREKTESRFGPQPDNIAPVPNDKVLNQMAYLLSAFEGLDPAECASKIEGDVRAVDAFAEWAESVFSWLEDFMAQLR